MKYQRLLTLLIMLAVTLSVFAASRATCDVSVFNGYYNNDSAASETIVTGNALGKYNLSVYKGLTLTGKPDEATRLEECIAADIPEAVDRETVYRAGRLYYAFLALKPQGNLKRYILYLNQHLAGGNKIILIYMEGKAQPAQIKAMLKK